MEVLPKDIWCYLMTFLNPRQWIGISRVNKKFYKWNVEEINIFWKPFLDYIETHWNFDLSGPDIVRKLCRIEALKSTNINFLVDIMFPFKWITKYTRQDISYTHYTFNSYCVEIIDEICYIHIEKEQKDGDCFIRATTVLFNRKCDFLASYISYICRDMLICGEPTWFFWYYKPDTIKKLHEQNRILKKRKIYKKETKQDIK